LTASDGRKGELAEATEGEWKVEGIVEMRTARKGEEGDGEKTE
jgi:hypothetical protein